MFLIVKAFFLWIEGKFMQRTVSIYLFCKKIFDIQPIAHIRIDLTKKVNAILDKPIIDWAKKKSCQPGCEF